VEALTKVGPPPSKTVSAARQHYPSASIGVIFHARSPEQCLVLRILSILAAIQSKCLPMNKLHSKPRRFQQISIKVNQGNSRCFFYGYMATKPKFLIAPNRPTANNPSLPK
jgi:hypothetical protein